MGVPSAFSRYFAPDSTIREEQVLNVGIAVMLLLAYGMYLLFSLKTHPGAFASVEVESEALTKDEQWSVPRAVGSLIARVGAGGLDERDSRRRRGGDRQSARHVADVHRNRVARHCRWRAESGSAIAMARKNKIDLSVGIALGSSIQMRLFVAPVLVLASYFIAPQPLDLSFNRAEVGSLFLGVILGTIVCGDGQSNWYKGIQLITVYSMMALMFFVPTELAR